MKKKEKIILLLLLLVLIIGVAFTLYVNDYYHAETDALKVLDGENITVSKDCITLKGNSDIGIIFYPGAKVEAESYLPILSKLRDRGFTTVLVKMPFNMAIFNVNAADKIIKDNSDIKYWYIAGHSMGGAMASSYAAKNQEKVEGLILLGSYIYGDYPEERALTIYGSLNQSVEDKINYTKNIVEIEGGNHAQFGNYGFQKGDLEATISAVEQQDISVDAITTFINQNL